MCQSKQLGRLGCYKPPIRSANASVAQINLSFRIPDGLRANRKLSAPNIRHADYTAKWISSG
jgi:hypothetical protein